MRSGKVPEPAVCMERRRATAFTIPAWNGSLSEASCQSAQACLRASTSGDTQGRAAQVTFDGVVTHLNWLGVVSELGIVRGVLVAKASPSRRRVQWYRFPLGRMPGNAMDPGTYYSLMH